MLQGDKGLHQKPLLSIGITGFLCPVKSRGHNNWTFLFILYSRKVEEFWWECIGIFQCFYHRDTGEYFPFHIAYSKDKWITLGRCLFSFVTCDDVLSQGKEQMHGICVSLWMCWKQASFRQRRGGISIQIPFCQSATLPFTLRSQRLCYV